MSRLAWSSVEQMIAEVMSQASAPSPDAEFVLTIDDVEGAAPHVLGFRGEQRMNALYAIDIVASMAIAEETVRPLLLGKTCHLSVRVRDDEPRVFHGIAARVELLRLAGEANLYHLEIVPRAWLMTQTRDSRVYQQLEVREILAEILNEAGVPHVLSLARSYTKRRYSLQYEESDFEFFTRLIAEEGIFYWFVHPSTVEELRELMLSSLAGSVAQEAVGVARDGSIGVDELLGAGQRLLQPSAIMQMIELASVGEVLVLGDTSAAYAAVRGAEQLVYRPDIGAGALAMPDDAISRFGLRGTLVPTRSTVRGYDPARAGRPPAGTVIGTVAQGLAGAFADGASTLVEGGSALMGEAQRAAGPVATTALGAVASASGVPLSNPLEAAGQANESVAFGVLTATHAVMPVEAGVITTAAAAATALAQQLIDDSGWDAALGSVGDMARGMAGGSEGALEIYEHHGEYEEAEASFRMARSRLEQLRARYVLCDGYTHNRRLAPGARFELRDHTVSVLSREYAAVRFAMEGVGWPRAATPVFHAELSCVPVEVPFRPERPERNLHQVVESAVVVAASEREIECNEHGSVKVQFRWDRRGKHDDKSSCFVRVMQAWAGGLYGVHFVPRVGMEVLVSFIGGDMNRPVVIGCMPNVANAPPYPLPERDTRSVIRTRSTPDGDGYNELMFEDRTGREQIFVRAERDMVEEIRNDQITRVLHDRTLSIENDHQKVVKGRSHTSIHGERLLSVEGPSRETVRGSRERETQGNDLTRVHGAHNVTVAGDASASYARDASTSVDGSSTLTVGRRHQVAVGTDGNGGSMGIHVNGPYSASSSTQLTLTAEQGITLQCGDSMIRMTSDTITLKAPNVRVMAGDEIILRSEQGATVLLNEGAEIAAEKITLVSSGALIRLDQDTVIDGSNVRLLNGDANGPSVSSSNEQEETQPLAVQLADAEGQARANCRYHVVVGNREYRGTTDGNGYVRQQIPRGSQGGTLTVWPREYPTGPRVTRALRFAPMGDASTPDGARVRLNNLGYPTGTSEGDDGTSNPDGERVRLNSDPEQQRRREEHEQQSREDRGETGQQSDDVRKLPPNERDEHAQQSREDRSETGQQTDEVRKLPPNERDEHAQQRREDRSETGQQTDEVRKLPPSERSDHMSEAVRHFQRDEGLESTGELDMDTVSKLRERHGS